MASPTKHPLEEVFPIDIPWCCTSKKVSIAFIAGHADGNGTMKDLLGLQKAPGLG
jgi:hypothetical protein